jgi:predicted nucleic-acid-binding protein
LPRRGGGMLAIDTNLVVRYLAGDHPEQSQKARALIDGEMVFVGATVLLESEWVLRSVYGFSSLEVSKALTAFAGLPNVAVEDAALAAKALDWAARGMDFADALHLARAQGCDAFASFDRRLAKAAKALSDIEIRTL